MQQTDRASGRFDLDGNGQPRKCFGKDLLPIGRQVQEPAAAIAAPVHDVHLPRADVADRIVFMVALHRMEPGPGQPFQRGLAFRAPVDQVAHGKQPVARRVETQAVQAFL
ncbi:hypothetical protein D3C71_1936100 [compost metagenome]